MVLLDMVCGFAVVLRSVFVSCGEHDRKENVTELSVCAYVLPYHSSMFLHTNSENLVKCRLEPTQTATTSSILCRRHGPIWPKLEQHVVSSPTCRDI